MRLHVYIPDALWLMAKSISPEQRPSRIVCWALREAITNCPPEDREIVIRAAVNEFEKQARKAIELR